MPERVRVSNEVGDIRLVLPAGPATYHVTARTEYGQTSVRVPTDRSSAHVITATDLIGDVTVVNG